MSTPLTQLNNIQNSQYMNTTWVFNPKDDKDFNITLTRFAADAANRVNRRTIGIHDTQTITTGESWPPIPSNNATNINTQRTQTFRTVYAFPITPHGTSTTTIIPHGLTLTNTLLAKSFCTLSDPLFQTFLAANYYDGTNIVSYVITATNIVVTTNTSFVDGYNCIIIIEYLPTAS